MRITIEHMKHFKAVADWGNLNLAASKISISPSAISRSIKIIEEDLGYLLFTRSGRNILINQNGKRFLLKAQNILASYIELYSSEEISLFSGTFKFGASHWLATKYLPSKLNKLLDDFSGLNFEVFSQDSNHTILKVLAQDLDFGICFSPKDHLELNSMILHEGNLLICANNKHPLLGTTKPISKISSYPAIIHKANEFVFSCIDHPMFSEFDITPNIKCYWDSDLTAIELMKSKDYWTMMPDIIIKQEPTISAFKHPKRWNAKYQIKLIWSKNADPKLTEILKDYFL